MAIRNRLARSCAAAFLLTIGLGLSARSAEYKGTVKTVDVGARKVILNQEGQPNELTLKLTAGTMVRSEENKPVELVALKPGMHVSVINPTVQRVAESLSSEANKGIIAEFWQNFTHNLFKPLLLFFYLGFLVPILKVKFEFPYAIYQALTIYLLIAIGWHGGEELSALDSKVLGSVVGFMAVGFITNSLMGLLAYLGLSAMTGMRRIDKATVAGYYGSDSAGTFVTCLGVLATVRVLYDAYMPVMLAVMEIPGCLVALYLISRLRRQGMDPAGTMPDELGYDPKAPPALAAGLGNGAVNHGSPPPAAAEALEMERELSLEKRHAPTKYGARPSSMLDPKLVHEVFLNPGLYLLCGGIIVGYISGLQGKEVTRADDSFFVTLFQGVLCLFLLEMGMTASRKLKDLKRGGIGFIAFGLIAPNVFATLGILVAQAYSLITHTPFELGTYVLFSVLCAAASYIAVPAVQRMAIPEASPTLPLAASLGLTFSYNVTIGIPVYIEIAKLVMRYI
jgi:uncharacterized protein